MRIQDTTGKHVYSMKIMNPDDTQTETIMTADYILGPYTLVREGLKPLNMSAEDFDLAVAPDGKAYYYFERVHSEIICADLTPDYTGVTGYYSTHFPHISPPYVREATAHFMRNGRHYLVTSGIQVICQTRQRLRLQIRGMARIRFWETLIWEMRATHLITHRYLLLLKWRERKICI